MRKIVIASHHRMAYGLSQTLEFLTKAPEVYEISAYVDDTDIRTQIDEVFRHIGEDDEVFIFTDMIGGSVAQQFYGMKNDHVHLICGMNLPLVLTVALSPPEPLSAEDIRRIIREAQDSIIYVNELQSQDDDSDDE